MNKEKRSLGALLSTLGNRKGSRKTRLQWLCIALFCATLLVNAVSLFFLPKTMGVPISGLEHLNRMSSALFLGCFTIMQGLLCGKGFSSKAKRCPIAGALLLGLDIVLVILNIMYPAGGMLPA